MATTVPSSSSSTPTARARARRRNGRADNGGSEQKGSAARLARRVRQAAEAAEEAEEAEEAPPSPPATRTGSQSTHERNARTSPDMSTRSSEAAAHIQWTLLKAAQKRSQSGAQRRARHAAGGRTSAAYVGREPRR